MPQFLKYTMANARELAEQFDIEYSASEQSKKSVKILKDDGTPTPASRMPMGGPTLQKKAALKAATNLLDDDDGPQKKSDPFKDLTNDSEDGYEFAAQRKARYVKSYTQNEQVLTNFDQYGSVVSDS